MADKDRKKYAKDLKTIYHVATEEKACEAFDIVSEKLSSKYPDSMKRWYDNWDVITTIYNFSTTY